jgi:hypothetical protein
MHGNQKCKQENNINCLNLKFGLIIFKHPMPTSKKTQPISITRIKVLKHFKEIIAVYTEDHIKSINTL